jgi:ABC-type Fe3+-hydroxamate transport system substrate-binding protein
MSDFENPPSNPEVSDSTDSDFADRNANPQRIYDPTPGQYRMPRPVNFLPERVISLVPSVTESLFDLNIGHRLVGITDYCSRPSERVARVAKVGGTKNPDIAKIISLRPDLVIMNDEENRREDAEALQTAGIYVWVTGPRTVLAAVNLLWEIMDVFDEASMVPRVRQIERVMDIVSPALNAEKPIRTFVPIWRDPWMTFNGDTYAHDLLEVLGMNNVFAERQRQFPLAADLGESPPLAANDPRVEGRDRRYPRITLAEIESLQPELVLLPNEPYTFTEEDAEVFFNMNIPAAQVGNIYLIDGSFLTWHGTRLDAALREVPLVVQEARQRLKGR